MRWKGQWSLANPTPSLASRRQHSLEPVPVGVVVLSPWYGCHSFPHQPILLLTRRVSSLGSAASIHRDARICCPCHRAGSAGHFWSVVTALDYCTVWRLQLLCRRVPCQGVRRRTVGAPGLLRSPYVSRGCTQCYGACPRSKVTLPSLQVRHQRKRQVRKVRAIPCECVVLWPTSPPRSRRVLSNRRRWHD